MTLLGLSLAQLASVFGALAGGVTLLYILRLRRRRVRVPFAQLWERVFKEKESTSLFRRLKRILSLLLQLLFLLLLTAALGDPRLSSEVLEGRHIILLVDTSASMKATDGAGGTRLAEAVRKAREIIRGMNGSDLLMLVRMDAQLTPLSRFESDETVLLRTLEDLRASDTRADITRALRFCADALRQRKNPLLIIVSDGASPKEVLSTVLLDQHSGEQSAAAQGVGKARSSQGEGPKTTRRGMADLDQIDLRGITVRAILVGKSGDNVGIVAFNARRYARNRTAFEMFLEVVNYRDKPAEVDLQIYADEELIEVRRLKLEPHERARYTCEPEMDPQRQKSWCALAASGELLMARLVPPGSTRESPPALDYFPVDDTGYAVLPRLKKQQVLLVTRGNLYLEGVLLLNENVELSKMLPEEYSAGRALKADALIFDGYWPQTAPTRPYLLLNPPEGENGPFASAGRLSAPLITDQDLKHPVMRWVTLNHVNISSTIKYRRTAQVKVLAASFREPVIVAYQQGALRAVAIGFDITRSDLPLRVAFPLLMINSLEWFMGEGESLITSYKTGEKWSVPLSGTEEGSGNLMAQVTEPDGQTYRTRVANGRLEIYGSQMGPYTITLGRVGHRIAANLADPLESDIAPQKPLMLGGRVLSEPGGFGFALRREIWIYLLLAALGLSLVEWLTYNRRITV